MTYDEANAALHALRDAGYDGLCLYMAREGYKVGQDLDDGQVYTSEEIDRMIAESESESTD